MENGYNRLAERLENIEGDVSEIKSALLGNEYTKNTGLIHSISEHHQRLTTLERLVDRGKWLIIGLSATSGVGIYEVLKQLFEK
jgi:Mg2+ and Co2+ transporter CorA